MLLYRKLQPPNAIRPAPERGFLPEMDGLPETGGHIESEIPNVTLM